MAKKKAAKKPTKKSAGSGLKTTKSAKSASHARRSAKSKSGEELPATLMKPPRAVQAALKKGLELKPEYGGKGLVATTLTWARKLAKGEPITPAKAKKMAAYFARHKVDKKAGWDDPPTPGYVAWLLWGGEAGKRWSERIVKRLDATS